MVKECRHEAPQLDLRLPLEHHERVRKVAALLQSTEAFVARLDELIATANDPPKTSFLSVVIDRIERMEAALLTRIIHESIWSVTLRGCRPRLGQVGPWRGSRG
jgi:hypothetical protein